MLRNEGINTLCLHRLKNILFIGDRVTHLLASCRLEIPLSMLKIKRKINEKDTNFQKLDEFNIIYDCCKKILFLMTRTFILLKIKMANPEQKLKPMF